MKNFIYILPLLFLLGACNPDDDAVNSGPGTEGSQLCSTIEHNGTPLELVTPYFFPELVVPDYNPLTVEGVELGRYLFWDKQLSRNNTISCGSCHVPEAGFSDPNQFSIGSSGQLGNRQSMSLTNVGWNTSFFWDGRANTLEEQILHPVPDHLEMDLPWNEAVAKIANDANYNSRFEAAFGNSCVDSTRISYAIAQFLRTMISANSKFDKAYYYGQAVLSQSEQRGLELFLKEGGDPEFVMGGQFGGDCFHCHGGSFTLFTDNQFHNNGLDTVFDDEGRFLITGFAGDKGVFKTPTLRNIELTAPYMHDGRFNTLEEVLEHYNSGGHASATIDPFMKYTGGGLALSEQSKTDLINFLKTLTDEEFVNDPKFSDPH